MWTESDGLFNRPIRFKNAEPIIETLDAVLRLDNPSRFNTAGTDLHSPGLTVLQGPYLLKVRIPSLFCLIVGMADVISDLRLFPADFAYFGHEMYSC